MAGRPWTSTVAETTMAVKWEIAKTTTALKRNVSVEYETQCMAGRPWTSTVAETTMVLKWESVSPRGAYSLCQTYWCHECLQFPWNSCDSIKIISKNPLLCIQKKKMFRRHIKDKNGHGITVWMRRSPMLLNVSQIVYAHLFCCILLLQGASVTSLFAIMSLDLSGVQPHCKCIFLYKVLALNATPKSPTLFLASDAFS